jgi:hypothetical protein
MEILETTGKLCIYDLVPLSDSMSEAKLYAQFLTFLG